MRFSIGLILMLILVGNACSDGLQMSSTSKTNAESGAISRTDVYTRSGETNLVRLQKILKDGTVQVRIHRFYQHGRRVADVSEVLDSFSIQTDANTPYHLDFEFRPDKTVRYVGLMSAEGGISDLYLGTNNLIAPVTTADLRKAQGIGTATIELMKNATNKSTAGFYGEVEALIEQSQE